MDNFNFKTDESDRDELEELVGLGLIEGMELISDEITSQGRWDTHHEVIFKHFDKYYRTFYSRGSTEQQDHGYEWQDIDENGIIDCTEVVPYKIEVTGYRAITKDENETNNTK